MYLCIYLWFFNNTVNSSCHAEKTFKMHSTVIFPAVLYGSKIWFLTLKEKRRLRVFEIGCWERYVVL